MLAAWSWVPNPPRRNSYTEAISLANGRSNISGYHLLTGATGLLGSYLLRDFLLAGRRVAVLVRPAKRESARQRVENLLQHGN